MEPKSGSRTLKKSASGGALGDRKKPKSKKKKDKRKPSVKGTESTDVPSPELDSEVPLDGDVPLTDQDGQTIPVGQVTRLPHLSSQTSLTTQTGTPPPGLVAASHKTLLGGHHASNSAPLTRSTAPSSTVVATPSANTLEGVVVRVANLNIKQRASKSRNKTQTTKSSSKSSRAKDRSGNGGQNNAASFKAGAETSASASVLKESMRWELVLEDTDQERERIAIYKMNRRKRYLAAAQAKGLGWAMNYNSQTNVTPLSEDSGVETTFGSPGVSASTAAYIDFSPVKTLHAVPAHRGLQEAFVKC